MSSHLNLKCTCVVKSTRIQQVYKNNMNTGGPPISWFLVPKSNHEMRGTWIMRTVFSVKPQNGSKKFINEAIRQSRKLVRRQWPKLQFSHSAKAEQSSVVKFDLWPITEAIMYGFGHSLGATFFLSSNLIQHDFVWSYFPYCYNCGKKEAYGLWKCLWFSLRLVNPLSYS